MVFIILASIIIWFFISVIIGLIFNLPGKTYKLKMFWKIILFPTLVLDYICIFIITFNVEKIFFKEECE